METPRESRLDTGFHGVLKRKGLFCIFAEQPSGFSDEFFVAFGTGDGDFSLALGHSHLLVTPGTIEIAVLLVFEFLEEKKKLSVFLVTLVNIPGEAPKNGNKHEDIGNGGQGQLEQRAGKEGCQQRANKAGTENGHVQFIRTVSATHKTLNPDTQTVSQIPQPVSKAVHTMLLGLRFVYIIFQIRRNSTVSQYF